MDRLEEFLNAVFSNEGSDLEYDDCWYNGNYTDQYCPCCPHANECGGRCNCTQSQGENN